jgi:hypothetical protein
MRTLVNVYTSPLGAGAIASPRLEADALRCARAAEPA